MSKNDEGKSGISLVPLAIAALIVCAVALMLMPAHASTEASDEIAATYSAADDVEYLPGQIANRGRESEPEIQMYY